MRARLQEGHTNAGRGRSARTKHSDRQGHQVQWLPQNCPAPVTLRRGTKDILEFQGTGKISKQLTEAGEWPGSMAGTALGDHTGYTKANTPVLYTPRPLTT